MIRLLSPRKSLAFVISSVLVVALTAVPVFAKADEEVAAKESWVLGYSLVVLGVALAMVAICRMGKRSKDFRQIEF